MKKSKLIPIAVAAVSTAAWALAYVLTRQPTDDEQRYAELHRMGSSYQRASTGQLRALDRVAPFLHLSRPSKYYRGRYDAIRQALVASGYLVEVTVPAPQLRAKIPQVIGTFSNISQKTGAYYEYAIDHSRDEVRLVCRKQDVSLWEKALKVYQ